ncbi:GumC family protein [Jejudonia soesokkakensis]|uniref:non-specific protein-tyrosine kinase n=1 Tax=Jejudonia soesokkakensis TaxID=1323432 RepID=A0ABW2MT27_9FLAO
MQGQLETKETPLRDSISQYTRYWFWFLLSLVLAAMIAGIYLHYTTPVYQSQATVIIKEDKNGGLGELSAFANLSFFSKFNNKIENELSIFRSNRIISQVIEKLNLNITYQTEGLIGTTELYTYKPFVVQYQSFVDSTKNQPIPKLILNVASQLEYHVENESKTINATYKFGERVSLPFGEITVLPVLDNIDKFESFYQRPISVSYRPIHTLTLNYQNKLVVVNEISNSNVVKISLSTSVPEKAEDFINELVFQYNKDAISDQNQVAQKTANFIDSRLEIITRELDSVEKGKEDFKSENRLTSIEAEAQLILNNASDFNKRQLDIATQLELANTMIDYMETSSSNDLLPANIGLNAEGVNQSVSNYNQLILERNNLLKTSTAINPVVVNVTNQIAQVRESILESLKNSSNALKVAMRGLNFQESTLNSKISQVPTKEKIFRGIERQQGIKEQLYVFLLQQREEASISLAVTAPKAKVVDRAYSSRTPIAPNRPLIYLTALVAGLLAPFLFIYGKSLLDTKIKNRNYIDKKLSNTALIGEIPKLKKGTEQLIQQNDRSVLAESFRILRTNLQYLFLNKLNNPEDSKTIFVTSSIKGEGKTFVAFNLALTIALTGKKVVLVGGDIRNPQLQRYLPSSKQNSKGLTEYIVDATLSVNEIASESENNSHLDIILSGAIPPNPAELLMEKRVADFFNEVKKSYDYVIVDTAPSMLVADTLLINTHADVTLYVIRAGYTDKQLLEFTNEAIQDERLTNVAAVINNVSLNNFGYGNKYGYAYSVEKPSLKQRLFGL